MLLPGRAISDNVLIAHEVIEFIRKIDMSKAYDRVSWRVLKESTLKMDFP